jgi:hypothetical protein
MGRLRILSLALRSGGRRSATPEYYTSWSSGITCISKVKTGTAFAVVFGWFGVLVLFGVGIAVAFS